MTVFLLFSKRSCNQLLSSNLISHLLTVSFIFLVLFPNILPSNTSCSSPSCITHDPYIYVYGTISCLKFFYLLEQYSEFPHLSSHPPNLFSPSISRSTSQNLPVYFYLSMSLQHTALHSKPDTLAFTSSVPNLTSAYIRNYDTVTRRMTGISSGPGPQWQSHSYKSHAPTMMQWLNSAGMAFHHLCLVFHHPKSSFHHL